MQLLSDLPLDEVIAAGKKFIHDMISNMMAIYECMIKYTLHHSHEIAR